MLEIRSALLPGSIPDEFEDLDPYMCDAKDDRTIDFLFRDEANRHVTIVQSKHRGADKSENESDFDSFRSSLKKLCPDTRGAAKINQKLLDIAADIEWDTDSFTLIYISLARHSANIAASAEHDLDDVPNSPLKDVSARSEILYLSEDEINKQWRDVVERRAGNKPHG